MMFKWFNRKKDVVTDEKVEALDIFHGKAFRIVLIKGQNYLLVNIPVVKKIIDGKIK